jgi:aminopeptidase N
MPGKLATVPDAHSRLRYAHLQLQLDPTQDSLHGVLEGWLLVSHPTDRLWLEVGPGLTVDSVTRADVPGLLPFAIEAPYLWVTLPTVAQPQDTVRLVVHYRGLPQQGGGIASYVRQELKGYPIIWTLSQPYGAREWWPTRQTLNTKLDSVRISVRHPQGYTAVANGMPDAPDTLADGSVQASYVHRYPIPAYLVAVAVAPYTQFSLRRHMGGGDSIAEVTYVLPPDSAAAHNDLAALPDVMGLFSELFLPYPYATERYGHAQFGFGGGMEHTTCSFMGSFWFELYVHELAHQWFGNMTTCGSWQDLWLNEGFATYLTGLAYEFLAPEYWQGWKEQQLVRVQRVPTGSVYATDTTSLSRLFDPNLTYRKAGVVLHQLRWLMGDVHFFLGCRFYLYSHYYGFARTEGLQRTMEQAADTSLATYFAEYIYGQGYPYWHLSWQPGAQAGTVAVALDQRTTHASVPFYHIPVPLGIRYRTAGGQERDTLLTVHPQTNYTTWQLQVPGTVLAVTLDPEVNLLRGETTYLTPRLQWEVYPNPSTSYLQVRWQGSTEPVTRLAVLDSRGRERLHLVPQPGALHARLPMDGLAAGFYLLQAHTAGGTYSRRIVHTP